MCSCGRLLRSLAGSRWRILHVHVLLFGRSRRLVCVSSLGRRDGRLRPLRSRRGLDGKGVPVRARWHSLREVLRLLARTLGGTGPVFRYNHLSDSGRRACRRRTTAREGDAVGKLDAVGHCLVVNSHGSWGPLLLATGALRMLGAGEVRNRRVPVLRRRPRVRPGHMLHMRRRLAAGVGRRRRLPSTSWR